MRRLGWGASLGLLLALSGCAQPVDRVPAIMPSSWTMTAQSGHIATVCFGSYEECGSLKWTYDTHSAAAAAVHAVEARLHDAGWTIDSIRGPTISASHGEKSQRATLSVNVTDGKASVTYVHA